MPHMTQTKVERVRNCPICREAKKVRRTFKERNENTKATKLGEVVCMDICEFTSPSIGLANYLLVLIDGYSKSMVVFPITNKSLVSQEIKDFVTLAENCFELRIATLRSDKEFKSNALTPELVSLSRFTRENSLSESEHFFSLLHSHTFLTN